MNKSDLRVIKYNDSFFDDNRYVGKYAIVYADEIESCYLKDTYDGYGQQLGGVYAGDYSLDNTECSMDSDIENAIRNEFPELDGSDIVINSDGEVYVDDEEVPMLSDFAREYDEENRVLVEAEAINYWDGHNYKSIILSTSNLVECEWEFVSDEEEERILDAFFIWEDSDEDIIVDDFQFEDGGRRYYEPFVAFAEEI